MRKWLCFLVLLTFSGAWAEWRPLKTGLAYRTADLGEVRMHQFRLDPSQVKLEVFLAADYGRPTMLVGELAEAAQAMVMLNGGYFDQDSRPMGYLKDGKIINQDINPGSAFGGILVVGRGKPTVLSRDTFQPGPERLALQCGPRLIDAGKPVEGIHDSDRRARTGVAVDGEGNLYLYACDGRPGLTFARLQRILTKPVNQGGLAARYALNLDGGSSTQMVLRHPRVKAAIPALVAVPVGVGVR
ncbi:MAG: phosphodiester glycosidase family protein [Candidatus Eremiobacteraeota bacterium]|nr:phosphodiester glycosidase family protein [Candidatus Eremiobacteraeota bacterium]